MSIVEGGWRVIQERRNKQKREQYIVDIALYIQHEIVNGVEGECFTAIKNFTDEEVYQLGDELKEVAARRDDIWVHASDIFDRNKNDLLVVVRKSLAVEARTWTPSRRAACTA